MYYLYRHIRLDKNQVFYIGIGTIPSDYILNQLGRTHKSFYRRAYDVKKSRNNYWKNVVNKTDYRIEIMFETDDIELIKEKEKEFIALYKNTLTNLTDGGGGIESYKHTQETKEKISQTSKGKKLSEEHKAKVNAAKLKKIIMYNDHCSLIFPSITEAARFLGLKSFSNISSCLHGRRNHVRGYKFKFNNEIIEFKDKEP